MVFTAGSKIQWSCAGLVLRDKNLCKSWFGSFGRTNLKISAKSNQKQIPIVPTGPICSTRPVFFLAYRRRHHFLALLRNIQLPIKLFFFHSLWEVIICMSDEKINGYSADQLFTMWPRQFSLFKFILEVDLVWITWNKYPWSWLTSHTCLRCCGCHW